MEGKSPPARREGLTDSRGLGGAEDPASNGWWRPGIQKEKKWKLPTKWKDKWKFGREDKDKRPLVSQRGKNAENSPSEQLPQNLL